MNTMKEDPERKRNRILAKRYLNINMLLREHFSKATKASKTGSPKKKK